MFENRSAKTVKQNYALKRYTGFQEFRQTSLGVQCHVGLKHKIDTN